MCSSLISFFYTQFKWNVWLHVIHTGLLIFFGVLAAVISWTSTESSMSGLTLKVLIAHQHLTSAHFLLPWSFQNSLSFCGLQIFRFSFSLVICYPSLWLGLLSQPNTLCCIHDRLTHILHKCDCLLNFNFWIFCHNNLTWAQCALSR